LYRAVIFDFDYTLGDATDAIVAGFTHGFAKLGLPAPEREAVRNTVGRVLEDAFTDLTGIADEQMRRDFHAYFAEVARPMQRQGIPLFPGAEELLRALERAGIKTAIVSTKTGDVLRHIMLSHGLEQVFSAIVGGEMVSANKPDPEGLISALDTLGVPAGEALYCGDTVIDAETAQRADCPFCAVLNGTTPAAAFAAYPSVHIARDLPDLKDWLGLP